MRCRSWIFTSGSAGIENEEEYDDMLEELMDRFGELPACRAESFGCCKAEGAGTSVLCDRAEAKGR